MITESKRERFVRLAELRVNNALKAINLIGNLSNKNNYSYSDEDYKKILRALKKSLSELEEKFSNKNEMKFKLK